MSSKVHFIYAGQATRVLFYVSEGIRFLEQLQGRSLSFRRSDIGRRSSVNGAIIHEPTAVLILLLLSVFIGEGDLWGGFQYVPHMHGFV